MDNKAKEINLGSKMNGLFKFNESDQVQGFYRGTAKVKHGEVLLISDLSGENTVGVPVYTILSNVPDRVPEGAYIKLTYKGMERSDNSGMEYMNIQAKAWDVPEGQKAEWDKKGCNVKAVLDALPEWHPEAGSEMSDDDDPVMQDQDDDLPF